QQHDGRDIGGKSRLSMRACACGCDNTMSLTAASLTAGGLSRRRFVAGAAGTAALAATGLGPFRKAFAQTAEKPYRIDVHHHLSPPTFIQAAVANNFGDGLLDRKSVV